MHLIILPTDLPVNLDNLCDVRINWGGLDPDRLSPEDALYWPKIQLMMTHGGGPDFFGPDALAVLELLGRIKVYGTDDGVESRLDAVEKRLEAVISVDIEVLSNLVHGQIADRLAAIERHLDGDDGEPLGGVGVAVEKAKPTFHDDVCDFQVRLAEEAVAEWDGVDDDDLITLLSEKLGRELRSSASITSVPVTPPTAKACEPAGEALPEGWTRSPLGELKHDSGYRIREGDAEFIVIDPRGFHVVRGRWPEEAALTAARGLIDAAKAEPPPTAKACEVTAGEALPDGWTRVGRSYRHEASDWGVYWSVGLRAWAIRDHNAGYFGSRSSAAEALDAAQALIRETQVGPAGDALPSGWHRDGDILRGPLGLRVAFQSREYPFRDWWRIETDGPIGVSKDLDGYFDRQAAIDVACALIREHQASPQAETLIPTGAPPPGVRELAARIVKAIDGALLDESKEGAKRRFDSKAEWVATRIAEHVAAETTRLRADNAELASQWDAAALDVTRLKAELARLRAAVEPFAKVASGIPDNWPKGCVLSFDDREDVYHLNYLRGHDNPIYPTIADWRRLAESAKGVPTVATIDPAMPRRFRWKIGLDRGKPLWIPCCYWPTVDHWATDYDAKSRRGLPSVDAVEWIDPEPTKIMGPRGASVVVTAGPVVIGKPHETTGYTASPEMPAPALRRRVDGYEVPTVAEIRAREVKP